MLTSRFVFVGVLVLSSGSLIGQNTSPFPSTGPVGIGTTQPSYPLQVIGNIKSALGTGDATGITIGNHGTLLPAIEFNESDNSRRFWLQTNGINGSAERLSLYGGPLGDNATNEMMSFAGNGNVGIGTTGPRSGLEVANLDGNYPSTTTTSLRVGGINAGPSSVSLNGVSTTYQILFSSYRDIQVDTVGAKIAAINNAVYGAGTAGSYFRVQNTDIAFSTLSTTPSSVDATTEKMRITAAGNVGIGTANPATALEVLGSITLTANKGGQIIFQDNSKQSTAWTGILSGGDYAESVDVTGDRSQYEPGDVLVIDPSSKGKFMKSTEPYSTAVVGVYSTRPGVVGRRQKTDKSHMKDEVPMAMVGVVPMKVSVESGSINPGDLLVTSSKPGYAMKGSDRTLLTGAIIGKALEPLDAGTGVIEAAVSIQ